MNKKPLINQNFLVYIIFLFFTVSIFLSITFFSFSNLNHSINEEFAHAEETETVYISDELAFESFLSDCSLHNLFSRGENAIQSVTSSKKYILTTDIYLRRKNFESSAEKKWNAEYFDGEFDGRGHSIVNFELDNEKAGVYSPTANMFGYGFFSLIGENGVVRNLNFVSANVDFSDKEAAIVAGTNAGSIVNVKAEGYVQGRTWAAGICVYNFGKIYNTLSLASVNLIPGEYYTGTSGYICAINSEDIYEEKKANLVNDSVTYVRYYELNSNQFYDKIDDVTDSVIGDDVLEESYVYIQNEEYITGPAHLSYIYDCNISDYYGTIWYLEDYKALYENDPNTSPYEVSMINDINLFNVEIDITNDLEQLSYVEVLKGEDSETFPYASFNRNSHNFYNRDIVSVEYDYSYINGGLTTPDESISLVGTGTKDYPYVIATLSDLLKCGSMEAADQVTFDYYMLLNDISLLEYNIQNPLIENFYGEFDGNGYSISGIFRNIFYSINEGSTVKNLRLSGKATNNTALLCSQNLGIISGVEVDFVAGSDYVSGIVSLNNGTISRCSVRSYNLGDFEAGSFAWEMEQNSIISYSRSLCLNPDLENLLPFIGTSGLYSESQISNCTNVNNNWNSGTAIFEKNCWVELGVIKSTETQIYDLIDNSNLTPGTLSHTKGWQFASGMGYAFKQGFSEDIPEMVFPSDNRLYKINSFFEDSYSGSSINMVYGSKPVYSLSNGNLSLISELDPIWAELEVINGSDDGDGFKIGMLDDQTYYIAVDSTSYITKEAIEWILLYGLNSANILALNPIEMSWHREGINWEEDYLSAPGEYNITFYSDLVDISAQLSISSENIGIASLSFSRKDYSINVNSILFNPLYIGIPDSALIITSVFLVNEGGRTPCPTLFINVIGNYVFRAEILGNENLSGYSKEYSFILEKGNLDIIKADIISSVSGFEEENAPTFNGGVVDFQSSLSITSIKPGYTISILATKLTKFDNSEENNPASFVEAGKYSVIIKVNATNYNEKSIFAELFIRPKDITMNISLEESSIIFCSPIPSISYSLQGEIYNYPVNGKTYSTNYSIGSSIGTYFISPAVSLDAQNTNYNIILGDSIRITVNKASLDISNVGFNDLNVDYDGNSHQISLDKTKIYPVTGDSSNPSITCTYKYLLNDSIIPFGFSNVGSYYLSAEISGGQNYNVSTINATLTISRREIQLFALNKAISFGDSKPEFSFSINPIIGTISSSFVVAELLSEANDIVVDCSMYNPQSTIGWPDKLVNPDYYELPILLTYSKVEYTNYEIVNNPQKDGLLRVNKISYSGELNSNEITYTGTFVSLSFKDGLFPQSINYYEVKGGTEYYLDTAPINVSVYGDDTRPNSSIYRYKANFLGNYKYKSSNAQGDFDIIQANLAISGLYLYANDNRSLSPLSSHETKQYSGQAYYFRPDIEELPLLSDTFQITIISGEDTYIDVPFSVRNVGYYSGISMEIKCQGRKNFADYISPYSIDFEVTPMQGTPIAEEISNSYNGLEIQPAIPMGESFLQGEDVYYPYFFGYQVKKYFALDYTQQIYTEIVDADFDVIKWPGKYIIDVWSNDPNYKVGPNNREEVTYILNSALINMDLNTFPETQGKVFQETYLNLRHNYLKPLEVNLSLGEGIDPTIIPVEFIINAPDGFIEPGEYDIVGAEDILHNINDSLFINCIRFNVEANSGKGKVIVDKREVFFDWTKILPSNLSYTGQIITYSTQLQYEQGLGSILQVAPKEGDNINVLSQLPANITKISINTQDSREILHSGSYTLHAECLMSNRYILREGLSSYTVLVNPIEIEYSVKNISIFSGDEIPAEIDSLFIFSTEEEFRDIFESEYSLIDATVHSQYDPLVQTEGYIELDPSFSINNGGNDYVFFYSGESSPKLSVILKQFPAVLFESTTFEYSENPISLVLGGNIPEGSSISYSSNPVEAGTYTIYATISKTHYQELTITEEINILKATPAIEITSPPPRILYRNSYIFTSESISARAIFNDTELNGNFAFSEGQKLKYGLNQYLIEFFPENDNYNSVQAYYNIESYIEEGDITISGLPSEIISSPNSTIEVKDETFTISLDSIENLPDEVYLYINGIYVYGGAYSFFETSDNVLVEVRTSYGTIYSTNINVLFAEENTTNPENPEENVDNNTPSSINGANPLKPGEIVGIAVGSSVGAIGIGFLIFFIIKRKNKNL